MKEDELGYEQLQKELEYDENRILYDRNGVLLQTMNEICLRGKCLEEHRKRYANFYKQYKEE